MGFDRKRMLEVADAVERVAKRADGVMARRDAEGVENWVYSGKESSHISRHPTLEAAKREANKQETKTGYEHHVHRLKPTGPGSYAVHSRHFPNWNRVQSGNRSNWTSEKGEPQDRVYMKAKRLGAQAHDRADEAENDADFDGITSRRLPDGSTKHRRLVTAGYRGSGRRYEIMTVEPGGEVYTQSRDGYLREHKSPEEAARHLGWESVPQTNT